MLSIAGDPGDETGQRERERAVQLDVEPERRHPDRVVTDALECHAERCAARSPGSPRRPARRARARRSTAASGWPRKNAGGSMPVMPPKPEKVRDLAEEVVADHRVGERQHQEVDAGRPRPTAHRARRRQRVVMASAIGTAAHGSQPELAGPRPLLGDDVADDEAGDPEDQPLSERHHARRTTTGRRCVDAARPSIERPRHHEVDEEVRPERRQQHQQRRRHDARVDHRSTASELAASTSLIRRSARTGRSAARRAPGEQRRT